MGLLPEFRAQFDKLIDQVKQELISDVNRRLDAQAGTLYELFAAQISKQEEQEEPAEKPTPLTSSPAKSPSVTTCGYKQHDGETCRTQAVISLAPSLYRIKSLPNVLSYSSFKQQSINCDYESQQVLDDSSELENSKSKNVTTMSPLPSAILKGTTTQQRKCNEREAFQKSSLSLQQSSTFVEQETSNRKSEVVEPSNNRNAKKDRLQKKKEKPLKNVPDVTKRKLDESRPSRKDQPDRNGSLLASQLNGAEKIFSFDKMKSLLTSNSPVIFVNRVPLSVLSSNDSARSVSQHLASTTFNENAFFLPETAVEVERQSDVNPPSSSRNASREEQPSWSNGEPTNQVRSGSELDINSLKKSAIHEMQKSSQYLKFINNHLRHKAHCSQDQNVKSAFDKYGHKLRKQLVKTIESVEQYQIAIGFQQSYSLQEKRSASSGNDDQGFFLDIIEKMRKLMTQMHLDMFQLICQEIEICLIEINNKFFVN